MATVVLTGFMGTGKTRVGAELAARLRRPFVDTDALVERAEGRAVSEIFARDGEAHFRAAERRAIAEALATPDAVIATGGGAIADPANFDRLHAAAPIVCLVARPETILERTQNAPGARPLLTGGRPDERVRALLAERAPAYARSDLMVETTARSVGELVDDIVEFLRRRQPSSEGVST